MSEFVLHTSTALRHACQLVYRSADGLIGLHITSGGTKPDRRRYFLWHRPDNAPQYSSEEAARHALAGERR